MNLLEFCNKHGYGLKKDLPNNWDRYGTGVPSVTTILGLLDDPGFNYVKNNYQKQLQSSIEQGLKAHSDAELFYKPQSGVNTIPPNVIKFHTLYVDEIIETEKYIERDGVCGTIDLIADIGGLIYNIDYKNSNYTSPKYKIQLGGYQYLNGNNGILVYLKGKIKIDYVNPEYINLFIELKEYFYNLLNKGHL